MIRGEAVLRLLRWLARPGGLMVVLEDLHWADPDTLAVLEYLGDNLGALPVLVLATSRDEPPPRHSGWPGGCRPGGRPGTCRWTG